ncbi:MAG: hypothetical protein SOU19_00620 [Candidatus Caccosoma sp.]|nr:hypothetical protein [Candidatus Caccosoma sp.]
MKAIKHKAASADFKEDMLPSTRKELFFDVLKNHYSDLIKIGLLLLLFLLPLFIVLVLQDVMLLNVNQLYSQNEIDLTTYKANILTIQFYTSIFEIPSIIFFFVGFSGILKLLKEYSFQEPVFFKLDFKNSIKENWKTFIILGLISAIILFISKWLLIFINNPFISYGQIGISFILYVPIILLFLTAFLFYDGKKSLILRSSCELYAKTFPTTILLIIIIFLPLLLLLIPQTILKYAMLLICVIIILPITLFVWVLYCNYIFDKYVNAYFHLEVVNKGLYNKKK